MTDFSLNHTGNWRAGEVPRSGNATHLVTYDQRTHAYALGVDEIPSFVEWVALQWETDSDPRERAEAAADYLDRIGVDIRLA